MRVLFVYPNLYTQMGFNHGLASLSACLKDAGHETELVNLNENLPPVPSRDEILTRIREWRPGLIGFSCLTMQYAEALRIAVWLREAAEAEGFELPPLVVGGIHPTMVPDAVMADGAWDHVGVGECEDAMLELARRVEAGEPADEIANLLSWKGGVRGAEVVKNTVGEFPDLTRIPQPDYELFDTQRIVEAKSGWFGLLSSRGCPYRCTYCLNHRVVDTYREGLKRSVTDLGFFRYRPIDLLLDEIRWVLDHYDGVGTFILDDDLFTQNAEHAIEFCRAYKAEGFDVPFVVNSHVKRLDPRVAEALASAGCRILKLGIESGSERVRREVLKRFMTDDDILATIADGERYGLHTSGFLMVGLPRETRAERFETVDLLARSGIGRFRTSLFYPFPGTESYEMAIADGYVDADRVATLTDFTESSCLDFGEEENLLIQKLAACMPWFVNARMDRYRDAPASERYRPLVKDVLAMTAGEWEAFEPSIRDRDAELADTCARAGELHYAIRFNAFMGVRSDYYLAEEHGLEWATAAAKPVPERLRELALAAAAGESC